MTALATGLVLVAGMFLTGPVAAAALALVAVFLLWLLLLSWPAVPAAGRVLRLTAVGLLVAGAVVRAAGG